MHYNKYIKIYTNILGGSLMNLFESDFHITAPIVAAHAPFGALKGKGKKPSVTRACFFRRRGSIPTDFLITAP